MRNTAAASSSNPDGLDAVIDLHRNTSGIRDLEQAADSIAYLHHGKLLFHENKDDLLQEYGLLRCGEADLRHLPEGMAVHTRRSAFGCETLVKGRTEVLRLLPGAVCDPAGIDDIMRFYSGRDGQ